METTVGALNMEQTMTLLQQWNLHTLMGDTYVDATYLCYSAAPFLILGITWKSCSYIAVAVLLAFGISGSTGPA